MRVAFAAACVAMGSQLGAQASSLSGTIVARETGERLAYAIVGIEGMDRAQFANDSGAFFFGDLGLGTVRLRVRRLGFQPFDTTLVLARGTATTARLALRRVALRLSEVDVRSPPPCRNPGPPSESDSALVGIFTQLRMNAEQYELLTRKHPLVYMLQVDLTARLKSDGSIRKEASSLDRIDALPKWRYKPGRLVARRGRGWFVHLPMLVDFANEHFIENHCFHYGGITRLDRDTLIQVDVVAAEALKTNDVSGSIYLDPNSFQIRRTVLQLTMPSGRFRDIVDFEIRSDFRELLESIPMIWRVEATQRFDARAKSIDYDEAYEVQQLKAYQFLKTRPGDRQRPKDS